MKKTITLGLGLLAIAMSGTFVMRGSQPSSEANEAGKLARQYMSGDLEVRPFIEKLFKDRKLGSRSPQTKNFKSHNQANTVRLLYTGLIEAGDTDSAKEVLSYALEARQPILWAKLASGGKAAGKKAGVAGKEARKKSVLSAADRDKMESEAKKFEQQTAEAAGAAAAAVVAQAEAEKAASIVKAQGADASVEDQQKAAALQAEATKKTNEAAALSAAATKSGMSWKKIGLIGAGALAATGSAYKIVQWVKTGQVPDELKQKVTEAANKAAEEATKEAGGAAVSDQVTQSSKNAGVRVMNWIGNFIGAPVDEATENVLQAGYAREVFKGTLTDKKTLLQLATTDAAKAAAEADVAKAMSDLTMANKKVREAVAERALTGVAAGSQMGVALALSPVWAAIAAASWVGDQLGVSGSFVDFAQGVGTPE